MKDIKNVKIDTGHFYTLSKNKHGKYTVPVEVNGFAELCSLQNRLLDGIVALSDDITPNNSERILFAINAIAEVCIQLIPQSEAYLLDEIAASLTDK